MKGNRERPPPTKRKPAPAGTGSRRFENTTTAKTTRPAPRRQSAKRPTAKQLQIAFDFLAPRRRS
jgi:hypothetical protein